MRGLNNPGVAILSGVSIEPSPVPPAPPPAPENPEPKPRLRWLRRTVLSVLGVTVLVTGVFELWRQGTIKSERDALAATMENVDDTILHGKTPAEYYNAHAKGRNGWPSYRGALKLVEAQGESEIDARLRDMITWQDEHANKSQAAAPPARDVVSAWLAASEGVKLGFESAADCDVIAREYRLDGAWGQVALAVMLEMSAWKIAVARVELLFAQGRQADAEHELATLLTVSRLRNQPGSLIEGLLTLGLGNLATDLAVRMSSTHRLDRETLAKLAANWPAAVPLLARMLEGELVYMCWLAETEPTLTSADGWFAWFPRRQSDEFSEHGPFAGIHMRRDIRKNMQHLQECLAAMLEGEQMHKFPAPHDMLSQFALDVRPQARRVIEHDVLFRMRKAAIDLRLLEHDGPWAQQRDKIEAFARNLHGISVSLEGDACVLSIVAAQFPGTEIKPEDATIRLKPLP